jgi:predicted transcriptional regulator
MKVLLSIKPQFAIKIFDGTKKFEFRKSMFKNANINTVVVYASSPMQKVIGEFTIDEIMEESPDALWEKTKKHSGITKEFFDEYFFNRDRAFAIKVKEANRYQQPLDLIDFDLSFAPQSFVYLYR